MTLRLAASTLILAWVALASGCSRPLRQTSSLIPDQPPMAELWEDPADLASRDLLHGPGGAAGVPKGPFLFVAEDTSGFSAGFDAKDADGLEWSIKLGAEAQSEVATSRLLWAIGFHQPPTYYLEKWTLTGAMAGEQPAGRFRPKLPGHEVVADWSWYENPFIGSRQYGGLIVANLMLNSWDWKTSNNKIYTLPGRDGRVRRQYVVRDVGASLGKTTYPRILKWFRLRGFGQGTRNDLRGFEEAGFIKRVDGTRIDFDYRGIYRDVIDSVTPADVRWTAGLMTRLSDRQWDDAFRAAGYTPEERRRYIAKIKEKIGQGLALSAAN
jgi:hypothetical protein